MSAAPNLVKLRNLSFEVTSGPSTGKTFQFSKSVIIVGRGADSDVRLESDQKISRAHVEIRQNNGAVILQIMNNKNTMMVNGQAVFSHMLKTNDCVLRLGETEVRIHADGEFANVIQRPLYLPNVGSNQMPSQMPPHMPSQVSHSAPPPLQYGQASSNNGTAQSKVIFYAIIGIVLILGLWIGNSKNSSTHKIAQELRKSDDVETDSVATNQEIKKIEDQIKKENKDSQVYISAQQYYLKGFRDYQQGQYIRAMISFQSVLAFNPQHELARKYLSLTRRKLDEMIRYEMSTGVKYKAQGNFRLCEASYSRALNFMVDERDPSYQDANLNLKECQLKQRNRF